jgi:hypothetical protein
MTSPPTSSERAAFYEAAVLGLRALDARERAVRRFGADAEAHWTQFAGALGAADRLDILLRDATVTWGAAFSPSECFGFFGLADDEPFGPDWGGIDDQAAKQLLADADGAATLDRAATVLGVAATPAPISTLTPATKLVVAGGAAFLAVAKAFAANRALSWTDQVVTIANTAAFRQLGGLAAVLLGARGRTVIVRSSADATSVLRAAGFAYIDAAIVSPDAEFEAAELARQVGGK